MKSTNQLMDRMLKQNTVSKVSIMSESILFNEKDVISTQLPVLNIAFSGYIDGGFTSGLTVLAGQSKSFKTLLGLYCLKAYLDKYEDSIGIVYDSEFGITPEYLKLNNIDPERLLHAPIANLEELKFDILKRLEGINREDHVFILIDSIGNLASKKEVDDALDEKSVSDMQRAKQIKSLFRMITPTLTIKDIPCVAINHVYQSMEMFSKTIVSGGTGPIYSSSQIFIITKSVEKNAKNEIEGYRFTITVNKSRYVKEGSKLPFTVYWDGGIDRNSALFDLAVDAGFINKVGSWVQLADFQTGEILEKKWRADAIPQEFYDNLLLHKDFQTFVENQFRIKA